jgi:hypothetical protein
MFNRWIDNIDENETNSIDRYHRYGSIDPPPIVPIYAFMKFLRMGEGAELDTPGGPVRESHSRQLVTEQRTPEVEFIVVKSQGSRPWIFLSFSS